MILGNGLVPAESGLVGLSDVAHRAGIDLRCERVPFNPHAADGVLSLADSAWAARAIHWRCELVRRAATLGRPRRLIVFCSLDRTDEPQLEEVLRLVLADAKAVGEPFETWARTYGYNPDSRAAEQLFDRLRKRSEDLKRFLGSFYEKAVELL